MFTKHISSKNRIGPGRIVLLCTCTLALLLCALGLVWLRFFVGDANGHPATARVAAWLLDRPFLRRLVLAPPGFGAALLVLAAFGALVLLPLAWLHRAGGRPAARTVALSIALLLGGFGIAALMGGMLLTTSLEHSLLGISLGPGTALSSCQQAYARAQQILQRQDDAAGKTLDAIITAVEQSPGALDALEDEEYIAYAELVCLLVDAQGGVQNERQHYFRNAFSRAPATLAAMVYTIQGSNDAYGWALMPVESTLLHMFGPDGAYNLKFVSENGHFEAVYDKNGTLLTEQNSPLNMGTFNYGSPLTGGQHHYRYDVAPYYDWNNLPGMGAVAPGSMQTAREAYAADEGAQSWRGHYNSIV